MKTFRAFDGKEYPVSDDFDESPLAVQNMNATIRDLGGRDPRAELGDDVPFDKIKFTAWTGPCGCQAWYIWRRDKDEGERTHYHHTKENDHINRRHCRAHGRFVAALHAGNARKAH